MFSRRTKQLLSAALTLGMALFVTSYIETVFAQGVLVSDTIISPSLEGNLVGDAAIRDVTVYLPPGYDTVPDKHYPVVYLLHGGSFTNTYWIQDCPVAPIADSLIEEGKIRDLIIVMPDGNNSYMGSWYNNSPVIGNYEDYIARDLVEHIDAKYRTIPRPDSRGIAGHSMGAYGAMKLALKRPDVFAAAAGHGGTYSLELYEDSLKLAAWDLPKDWEDFWKAPFLARVFCYALAAGLSPNEDNPPLFIDYPFKRVDNEIVKNDEIWSRWLENDVIHLIDDYTQNPFRLEGIFIVHGISDATSPIIQSRMLDEALSVANVPHIYEEHPASHFPPQIQLSLPFFSDILSFQSVLASVDSKSRLAITWAEIKSK